MTLEQNSSAEATYQLKHGRFHPKRPGTVGRRQPAVLLIS